VVLVALPDDTLETTYEQLAADYPGVQFRKVRSRASALIEQHKVCWAGGTVHTKGQVTPRRLAAGAVASLSFEWVLRQLVVPQRSWGCWHCCCAGWS
jgi:hypothetical protein